MQQNPKYAEIMRKLESDPDLRAALITNTVETLKKHGIEISESDIRQKIPTSRENIQADGLEPMGWLFVPGLVACSGCF